MTDLTNQLLPALRSHRLPGLDAGEGFIYPNYAGSSILNLPDSICAWLGAPGIANRPLAPQYQETLLGDVRRVILLVVDALALHRLQRWMQDGSAPVWRGLAQDGLLAPLTSVSPSTTSSALTSLWTGRSPAEHGIPGYEIWLKEYGLVASMIYHAPISFRNDIGSLEKAGFKPEAFMNLPTLGSHLRQHGVKATALQHRSIINSGLSQMFFKDVEVRGYHTLADLFVNLRHVVEDQPRERQYIWAYTGDLDTLSHYYGPDDERTQAGFSSFSHAFEQFFLNRLSPAGRRGTLLVLTADHGQISTQREARYELSRHPDLAAKLHILPTGESRLMYLYVHPGQSEALREYFSQSFPDQFALLEPARAVERGLLGPGTPHPRLLERMGDLIAAARGQAYLWWADQKNHLIGRHGGLSEEEMLVPFLAARLDA
jgi:predicted AlkP superfamily pyrophosphatase or phosphodiesterase